MTGLSWIPPHSPPFTDRGVGVVCGWGLDYTCFYHCKHQTDELSFHSLISTVPFWLFMKVDTFCDRLLLISGNLPSIKDGDSRYKIRQFLSWPNSSSPVKPVLKVGYYSLRHMLLQKEMQNTSAYFLRPHLSRSRSFITNFLVLFSGNESQKWL